MARAIKSYEIVMTDNKGIKHKKKQNDVPPVINDFIVEWIDDMELGELGFYDLDANKIKIKKKQFQKIVNDIGQQIRSVYGEVSLKIRLNTKETQDTIYKIGDVRETIPLVFDVEIK